MIYPHKVYHGLMFHHFHGGSHRQGQGSITGQDFENILNFIGPDRIIHPYEWIERLKADDLSSEHVCLTFDDGLLSQIDLALPILEKYHLHAFWFIYSSVFEGQLGDFEIYRAFRSKFFENIDDFYEIFFARVFNLGLIKGFAGIGNEINLDNYRKEFPFYSINDIYFRIIRDRLLSHYQFKNIMDGLIHEYGTSPNDLAQNLWMSNSNLAYLSKRGHVIGMHSYSHPMTFSNLSFQGQWEECTKNYTHIMNTCGIPPESAAHPVNSYNDNTFKILHKLGITCGFRSNMAFPLGEERLNPDQFQIAREDHANIIRMMREQQEPKKEAR